MHQTCKKQPKVFSALIFLPIFQRLHPFNATASLMRSHLKLQISIKLVTNHRIKSNIFQVWLQPVSSTQRPCGTKFPSKTYDQCHKLNPHSFSYMLSVQTSLTNWQQPQQSCKDQAWHMNQHHSHAVDSHVSLCMYIAHSGWCCLYVLHFSWASILSTLHILLFWLFSPSFF